MVEAVNDPTTNEGYMVEVIGHDGVVHHLGPFRSRADAEAWMEQNTRQTSRDETAQASDALPRLSLV
jgi:hypothetical protein